MSSTEPVATTAAYDAAGQSGPAAVRVLGADHLVLRVRDPQASLDFYVGTLGLEPERVEQWRAGTVPFPSVRVSPTFVIDLDPRRAADGKNVEHYCLEIAETDLLALQSSGRFDVLGVPVRRWGARGPADLVYVHDPDGHVIELRHYGPSQGLDYGRR